MMKRKLIISALILVVAGMVAAFGFRDKPSNDADRPDSQLVDKNNKPVDFDEFKGKVVFVNNWASWCPPCVAEMPSIQKLKDKLEGSEVVFVMVSFDENQERATAFLKKRNFDFDLYYPGKNYPYLTSSIPATFIIDKKGKVVMEKTGMADYSGEEVVEQLKALANE